jgi:hypothetical protein
MSECGEGSLDQHLQALVADRTVVNGELLQFLKMRACSESTHARGPKVIFPQTETAGSSHEGICISLAAKIKLR